MRFDVNYDTVLRNAVRLPPRKTSAKPFLRPSCSRSGTRPSEPGGQYVLLAQVVCKLRFQSSHAVEKMSYILY